MNNIKLNLENFNGEYSVEVHHYNDDTRIPALILNDVETYEDEVITLNLIGYGIIPAPGNIIIKEYNGLEGMTEALLNAGVITKIVTQHSFGYLQNGATEAALAEEYRK